MASYHQHDSKDECYKCLLRVETYYSKRVTYQWVVLDHLITDKQDKIDVSVNEGHSMQKSSSLGISNIRVENVPLISTILVVDINAT